MNYIFIILIIITITLIISCTLPTCENFYPNYAPTYSDFIYNNKDLNNILHIYNSMTGNTHVNIENVTEMQVYNERTLDGPLRSEMKEIISKVLDSLNRANTTEYSFLEFERVNVKRNHSDDRRVSVIFLMLEKNKYSIRKLLIDYCRMRDTDFQPTINYIKTIQSDVPTTYTPLSNSYQNISTRITLSDQLDILTRICSVHTGDISMWKPYGSVANYIMNHTCTARPNAGETTAFFNTTQFVI